jgi:predicted DNA-binding protein
MSTTTSVRLSDNLRVELEAASQRLHRGKNWLISEALWVYLESFKDSSLEKEARRQSLLVSQRDQVDTFWEDNADTQGWV